MIRPDSVPQVADIVTVEERLSQTLSQLAHDARLAHAPFVEIVRFVLEAASDAIECERVSAWHYEAGPPRELRCISLWERQRRCHTGDVTLGEDQAATYLASLQRDAVLAIDDVYADPRCVELAESYLPAHGITSMLDAPFQFDARLAGVICFEHVGTQRHWSAGEQHFSANMASLLSIALESEQRRIAHDKLLEEQRRFQNLVGNIPSGVVIAVGESIAFANEAAAQLVLLDGPEQLIGENISKLFGGPEVERLAHTHAALLSGRSGVAASDYALHRSDGSLRYVEIASSRVTWDGQAAVQSLIRDVTDRVKAERQAVAAGERFSKLANSFTGGFTYIDADERYVFVNQTYADWLGLKPEDFLGRQIRELAGEQTYAEVEPHLRTVLAGKSVVFERQSDYAGVGRRHVQLSYIPDLDESGAAQGFFALAADITEQKVSEAALAQAQRMESLGLLTGGISHDFNNLLAVIIGSVEMAQVELHSNAGAIAERLETILKAAERGADLTHGLLAFSRKQTLEPTVVNVRGIVAELVKILSRTLPADIDIQSHFDPDLWRCQVDRGQLESALLNLAINARDAMPAGGTLTFSCDNECVASPRRLGTSSIEPGDYVAVRISDTGTGMSASVLERVFEPFFTTKEVNRGTGLGLSMVFGFVKQSGGHVAIESTVGVGSMVHLYLPMTTSNTEVGDLLTESSIPAARGETILVVEDDPDLLELISSVLDKLGYRTLTAANGPEALERIRSEQPIDMLLTDLVLPGGLRGEDVAVEVRSLQPQIAVLFMSGYADKSEFVAASAERAESRLLRKPFRMSELGARVRETLNATSIAKHPPL